MGSGPDCTLDEARAAVEAWVETTRWKRRGIAGALAIESFEHSGAEHVVFQSFVEQRAEVETHVPYRGGDVDGPERGEAPGPWAVGVTMPALWTETRRSYEIPHTALVRECHGCDGRGTVTCSSCDGRGKVSCSSCGGSGTVTGTRTVTTTDANGQMTTSTESTSETCSWCIGSGRVRCSHCAGDGRVTCSTCEGACRLKHFRRLDVAWRTHTTEKILEKTDLPDELVKAVTGVLDLSEEDERIEPKAGGGGPFRGATRISEEVNAAANELIAGHAFDASQRLHRQRLVVRGIPVHEARYRWGKATKRFWVYGLERAVHAPDYPLSRSRIGSAVAAVLVVVGSVGAALAVHAHWLG